MHDNRLDFDGIFCVTDYLAQRVIQILRSFHLRVPEDVQIIGFDGVRLFDENYLCSTIVQPVKQIAEMCVELLLQKKDTLTQHLVCLPVTYAYGGTTLENTEEDS